MASLDYLAQRAIGEDLPISLPTAVAIRELLIGEHKDAKYQEVWINIRTLIRNLLHSLDADTLALASDIDLSNVIVDEIEILESVFRDQKPTVILNFYIAHYDKLKKLYPQAVFREVRTARQRFNQALLDNTYQDIIQFYQDPKKDPKIKVFDLDIVPVVKTVAIFLTHVGPDLTSEGYFKSVRLLESHTGKLKDRSQWYTKFSTENTIPFIPFLRATLAILGDSEVFRPQGIKLRKALVETSEKYHWSSVTTLERMKLTLGYVKDAQIREQLVNFIH